MYWPSTTPAALPSWPAAFAPAAAPPATTSADGSKATAPPVSSHVAAALLAGLATPIDGGGRPTALGSPAASPLPSPVGSPAPAATPASSPRRPVATSAPAWPSAAAVAAAASALPCMLPAPPLFPPATDAAAPLSMYQLALQHQLRMMRMPAAVQPMSPLLLRALEQQQRQMLAVFPQRPPAAPAAPVAVAAAPVSAALASSGGGSGGGSSAMLPVSSSSSLPVLTSLSLPRAAPPAPAAVALRHSRRSLSPPPAAVSSRFVPPASLPRRINVDARTEQLVRAFWLRFCTPTDKPGVFRLNTSKCGVWRQFVKIHGSIANHRIREQAFYRRMPPCDNVRQRVLPVDRHLRPGGRIPTASRRLKRPASSLHAARDAEDDSDSPHSAAMPTAGDDDEVRPPAAKRLRTE